MAPSPYLLGNDGDYFLMSRRRHTEIRDLNVVCREVLRRREKGALCCGVGVDDVVERVDAGLDEQDGETRDEDRRLSAP